MKNFNDGKCHTLDEIKDIESKTAAKQFAEGDENLEKVLLTLWEMGIETSACCKGLNDKNHKEGLLKTPYLVIEITPKTHKIIMKLIKYILNEKSLNKPNIIFKSINFNNNQHNIILLEKSFLTNNAAKKMFESILSALAKMQKEDEAIIDTDLEPALKLINHMSHMEISNRNISEVSIKITSQKPAKFKIESKQNKKLEKIVNNKTIYKIKNFCEDYMQGIESSNLEK